MNDQTRNFLHLINAFADPVSHALPPLRITMGLDTYFAIFPSDQNDPAFPCGDLPCEFKCVFDVGTVAFVIDDRDTDLIDFQFGTGGAV